MSEPVTASQLRQDVYRILDQVIETGEPRDIVRKGRHLRLIAVEESAPHDIFDRIPDNADAVIGDPEDLVHLDWSDEWDARGALHP